MTARTRTADKPAEAENPAAQAQTDILAGVDPTQDANAPSEPENGAAGDDDAAENGQILLALTDGPMSPDGLFKLANDGFQLWLIFGKAGDLAHMAAVPVESRHFALVGGKLVWTGTLEHVAGPEMGNGRDIDTVALAVSPHGPIVALCELSPFRWAAGAAFGFARGAFTF